MRIGIHVGTIIGGVTGSSIVRYDIYGPDVMVANKMESEGEPGRVHISEVTKTRLELFNKKQFAFERNKHVEISLMKKEVITISIDTYFVKTITPLT